MIFLDNQLDTGRKSKITGRQRVIESYATCMVLMSS